MIFLLDAFMNIVGGFRGECSCRVSVEDTADVVDAASKRENEAAVENVAV